ncbi:TIGR03086 family metal-binding protein [Phytomonospora endophytica]|uniref:Uncharacterized protein (TIGR03086 family) n=1 Tax=Phytomonospora endophytica TaxID=714109 RepID=A0A841FKP4_9ACTN|nr:TIGR03086 family metal-binding protein [Phytomonospora endophytica]MBB6036434.1 uncharacterized protein (TIGR03086 family) [Phytomonospora endophytica]GIG65757.1 TIGR03086 family protein [Phytomonospora endophytica]
MADFADRYVTEPDPMAAYERLVDTVEALLASVRPEQMDDPTPCGDWDVRRVIAHLADTTDVYATLASTGEIPEDTPTYEDPIAAFPIQAARAREAFNAPGYLTEVRPTPIGPQPGSVAVQHVVNELLTHSWDLAKGLGTSTDLVPDIATRSLESWKVFFADYPREAMGFNFDEEHETAEGMTEADRVAAYLGR